MGQIPEGARSDTNELSESNLQVLSRKNREDITTSTETLPTSFRQSHSHSWGVKRWPRCLISRLFVKLSKSASE